MRSNKENIAIIGAGPAGLSAAWFLAQKGLRPTLFEAGPQPGGLARSLDLWGSKVDLGPHSFYADNPQVSLDFFEAILGDAYLYHPKPQRALWVKGKKIDVPYRPLNLLQNLGPRKTIQGGLQVLYRKFKGGSAPLDAKEAFIAKFGRTLYKTFFLPFCYKYFGRSPEHIDPEFVHLLHASRTGNPQGRPGLLYPKDGIGALWEGTARKLTKKGIRIHYNTPIQRILRQGETLTGVQLQEGTQLPFDRVISTLPPTILAKCLHLPTPPSPLSRFHFRHTALVYLKVAATHTKDLYQTSYTSDFQLGRVTCFGNWHQQKANTPGVVAVEYWCAPDAPLWAMTDSELVRLAKGEVQRLQICTLPSPSIAKVIRLPRSYPVLHLGFRQDLAQLNTDLNIFKNLDRLGRHARFQWDGQEDNITAGFQLSNLYESSKSLHSLRNPTGTDQVSARHP